MLLEAAGEALEGLELDDRLLPLSEAVQREAVELARRGRLRLALDQGCEHPPSVAVVLILVGPRGVGQPLPVPGSLAGGGRLRGLLRAGPRLRRALAVVLAPGLRAAGHRLPRLAADILGAGAARLLRLLLHPLLRLPGRSRLVAQAGGLAPRLRGLLRRSAVPDVACPATSDASPALRSRALSPRGPRRSTGRWRRRSARSGRHVGIVPSTRKSPRNGGSFWRNPAATYSPRGSPPKYHRRWRA